jgi:glucans biosynthesis protein
MMGQRRVAMTRAFEKFRVVLGGVILAAALVGAGEGVAQPAADFTDFAAVEEEAARLASVPYQAPGTGLRPDMERLSYDRYQSIRFRPTASLLQGQDSLFRAQLFPAGFLFRDPVTIDVMTPDRLGPVSATASMFDWAGSEVQAPPDPVPLAGFRLLYPLHGKDPVDEIAAFLGASYFRLIGREQIYGASARGLAIDSGSAREEFPAFRRFWLLPPKPGASTITVFALLDSPGVAGAYRFDLHPGTRTVVDISATLHFRHAITTLGLAPLTSMFLSGEGTGRRAGDFRPEVHDSDGLLMVTGTGEHLWRPLANPAQLSISVFGDTNPRGFGLFQRDRDFAHYEDLEAQYHKRPSFWVEPEGDWGEGEVRLIEIPTDSEIHDNVVAFWTPRQAPKGGERIRVKYRLSALADEARQAPRGRVVATRMAATTAPGVKPGKARRMVVDFAGRDLDMLRAEQPVEGEVSLSSGKLIDLRVQQLPDKRAWRLVFDVEPDAAKPVEMRAFLRLRGEPLTETWTQRWQP